MAQSSCHREVRPGVGGRPTPGWREGAELGGRRQCVVTRHVLGMAVSWRGDLLRGRWPHPAPWPASPPTVSIVTVSSSSWDSSPWPSLPSSWAPSGGLVTARAAPASSPTPAQEPLEALGQKPWDFNRTLERPSRNTALQATPGTLAELCAHPCKTPVPVLGGEGHGPPVPPQKNSMTNSKSFGWRRCGSWVTPLPQRETKPLHVSSWASVRPPGSDRLQNGGWFLCLRLPFLSSSSLLLNVPSAAGPRGLETASLCH